MLESKCHEERTVVTYKQPIQDHMNACKSSIDPDHQQLSDMWIEIRAKLTCLLHSVHT
jgi:hypothetical protein